MPRGKYVNHKGRSRQFTPSDQLQQELGMMMNSDQVRDLTQGKSEPNEHEPDKASTRGIQDLIEVSNPNRLPHDKLMVFPELDKTKKDKTRDERKLKQGPVSSQAQADLDRLFIVRKEREAAAERRLAAKKAAAEADASRLVSSLKKLTKQCPGEDMKSPKALTLRGK
ncbi:28 kDa heat- and acid-stable phosphoprotein-like [Drosophila serrata]|uniref:28 kDa heat- and acid-stable phosphoprotein-like n=1 Tax=Drosophila serrata TaxID=7274 RepID=UPI000A1D0355|nr:28 kDa heat- and acid-stable phosphoprotein-like [Drosophila serrata]